VSNVEKITPLPLAQNHQIYQQYAAFFKGHTQSTTRHAQYIRKSPGNITTSKARKFNIQRHPTPTPILNFNNFNQPPKTHTGTYV